MTASDRFPISATAIETTHSPYSLIGVGGQFTARHIDPILNEGEHEHTWQVIAWWPGEPPRDARALKVMLGATLDALNGTLLRPELWSGEDIAKNLTGLLNGCVGVDVSRPVEGYYAKARWP